MNTKIKTWETKEVEEKTMLLGAIYMNNKREDTGYLLFVLTMALLAIIAV